MSIDPEEVIENEAARIFKPITDLLAEEAEELKRVDELIEEAERKANKLIVPAKRMDED